MALNIISQSKVNIILYSTVNRRKSNIFINKINNHCKIIDTEKILKKQTTINYKNISGIGKDRILGLLGALTLTKPPLITVDCGTAITINVLDSRFECLGGAIIPGISTQLSSLLEETSEIKNIEFIELGKSIGCNTQESVSIGILQSCKSGITSIIENIQKEFFKSDLIPIIITGGTGKLIQKNLKIKNYIYYSEALVLKGILSLIRYIG